MKHTGILSMEEIILRCLLLCKGISFTFLKSLAKNFLNWWKTVITLTEDKLPLHDH